MTEWTQYRRSAIAEMRPWTPGDDMTGVSVSSPDAAMGSPLHGDMIARNPKNHADQWLVAAAYFADNFLPMAPPDVALPPLPEGWVEEHVKGKRTEAEVRFSYLDEGGCGVQVYAMADAVRFWQVGTVSSVPDLILILRHAQAAQAKLAKEAK